MARIRVITDVNTTEDPTEEFVNQIRKQVWHFADAVVADKLDDGEAPEIDTKAHVHNATQRQCAICAGASVDEKF